MLPQIEIIGIDFLKAYLEDDLIVHFRVLTGNNKELPIRVRIEDPFFKTSFFMGPLTVRCREGVNFWVNFRIKDIMTDPILGFKGGFVIIFEDETSGEEIYRRKFVNRAISYGSREVTSESPYDSPRLFMIGDSHTWTNFGQHSEGISKVGSHTMIRHVIYGVSSHTFWTGDFKGYLRMLPVESQDSFLFSFGTYDFRKGAFKISEKRGVPLNEIVYQTLFQKFYKLRYLREQYPDNHFIICSIVPPVRENFLSEDIRQEFLWRSRDEERVQIYETYVEFWKRHINFLPNASFLDWTEEYKDEDGFCIPEMMRPGDIHVGNYRSALKKLEDHLAELEKSKNKSV